MKRYHQLLEEHGHLSELAARLDAYTRHDGARLEWIRGLVADTRTHVEQEEAAVLPALRARMTDEELAELGNELERARLKAPTRPHPHAAGSGRGARLIGRLVRPIDAARDVAGKRRPA